MSETRVINKTVIDFFAGIGLVRYALERRGWKEIFALDHSHQKSAIYKHHFGESVYYIEDVHNRQSFHVPAAVLAHASFPCTDTSVAGSRAGLAGPGSSAFGALFVFLQNYRMNVRHLCCWKMWKAF